MFYTRGEENTMAVATRGSSAYDYRVYEPDQQPYTQEQRGYQGQTRASKRRALAARRAAFFLALVLVAGVCIGLLLVKSRVAMQQRTNNTLHQQITEQQRVNSELRADLKEKNNVGAIMSRADELGMQSPDGEQLVFITMNRPATLTMSQAN